MANPTTNYGFVLPTSTDLVTDLPADFDVALQGVDTRLKALQPGTTLGDLAYSSATANTNTRLGIGTSGQVLAVSGGGVPAWTTTADVTPLTTKGDLFTFTTVDARIGVGANNTVLTADSAEAAGLKWATPAGNSWSQIATGSLSGSQTNITGLTGSRLLLILDSYSSTSTTDLLLGVNNNAAVLSFVFDTNKTTTTVTIGAANLVAAGAGFTTVLIEAADTAAQAKPIVSSYGGTAAARMVAAFTTSAITQLNIATSAGTWDAGTYTVWSYS